MPRARGRERRGYRAGRSNAASPGSGVLVARWEEGHALDAEEARRPRISGGGAARAPRARLGCRRALRACCMPARLDRALSRGARRRGTRGRAAGADRLQDGGGAAPRRRSKLHRRHAPRALSQRPARRESRGERAAASSCSTGNMRMSRKRCGMWRDGRATTISTARRAGFAVRELSRAAADPATEERRLEDWPGCTITCACCGASFTWVATDGGRGRAHPRARPQRSPARLASAGIGGGPGNFRHTSAALAEGRYGEINGADDRGGP